MHVIVIWQCLLQSPVKKHERITMKSLLSEAEKKEILDEATVKTFAAHVLNLMKNTNKRMNDVMNLRSAIIA